MGEIGVAIAIVAGVILGLVLLNKLLEYLFYRFTLIYNVVLIVIAVASNLLALVGADALSAEVYVGLQVLFFYLLLTRCDPDKYETVETDVRVSDDSVHASSHLESHYRPGWWVKLTMVAFFTVAAVVLSVALESPILTLVLEVILPGIAIIGCLRRR